MSRLCLPVLLTLICVGPYASAPAEVPLLINYQGLMEGSDSTQAVTFAIHDNPTAGQMLWSEDMEVTVVSGRFSVLLGSVTPLSSDLFAGSELYLSLAIAGEELTPRQRIVSVAYALRSRHAESVTGEDISPRSLLIGQSGAWDSSGALTAPVLSTDSVIVGSTAVIDSKGNWVGPPTDSSGGLNLTSFTQTNIDEESVFFFNSRWLSFPALDTFVEVPTGGKLDISFIGQISCPNPFETRLNLKQVTPVNQFLGQVGNTSGATSSNSDEGATVHNQAIIEVEPGTYRIFVEHMSASVIEGTLHSASLIIRHYE